MNAKCYQSDFNLGLGSYLLNHSVGRPLTSTVDSLRTSFFSAWEKPEPWGDWLAIIDNFRHALSHLFNAPMDEFCPQTNVSSSVAKIIMSLDRLNKPGAVVMMSEIDFPTIGFALRHALSDSCELRFIPKHLDITNIDVWRDHLTSEVTLVFVSHAYSNTGQLAPLTEIIRLAKEETILTIVDVAQSAGIIPIDLANLQPSFMVGSSIKWLCGGPGAGFLWINPAQLDNCHPTDVGWFSHENPFEFNIHDFRYHQSSLKFWGGTPSIIPFAIAAHSIHYLAAIGSQALREHNQKLIELLAAEFDTEYVSPRNPEERSGTVILNFSHQQEKIMRELKKENIMIDARAPGIRVSPHLYNNVVDMEKLIRVIKNK